MTLYFFNFAIEYIFKARTYPQPKDFGPIRGALGRQKPKNFRILRGHLWPPEPQADWPEHADDKIWQ